MYLQTTNIIKMMAINYSVVFWNLLQARAMWGPFCTAIKCYIAVTFHHCFQVSVTRDDAILEVFEVTS